MNRSDLSTACLSCLAPNERSAEVCKSCGEPLDATSNLDPMKAIRLEGALFQKAVSSRPKLIVVVGVWIIFVPWLVASGAVAISSILYPDGFASIVFFCVGMALSFVAVKIMFTVTHNYVARPAPADADGIGTRNKKEA